MAKKQKKADPFSESEIRRRRQFPKGKTLGILALLALQILAITFAVVYTPLPQDRIDSYEITARPHQDGSVDLKYELIWTALDSSEELTWVDIGMANPDFTFHQSGFSSNIASYEKYTDGDYVSARLHFDRPYQGGETLRFSFSVRQEKLLCQDESGYFYEFVPGWFNSTPVEHYRFLWEDVPKPLSVNTDFRHLGSPLWEGSMPCGSYVKMQIRYGTKDFAGAVTVPYQSFYDGDVVDELAGEKVGIVVLAVLLCLGLLAAQIYLGDSVVSYHRGRGFLSGYGHPVYLYGSLNPKYKKARDKDFASSHHHSRSHSGGCACACACACAGGGRAGCSQKDGYRLSSSRKKG